jgi:hypothetical protein
LAWRAKNQHEPSIICDDPATGRWHCSPTLITNVDGGCCPPETSYDPIAKQCVG